MKALGSWLGITVVAVGIMGCGPGTADHHAADVKALGDYEVHWNAAWATKDPAQIAAYYADDAVLIAPGGPAVNGRAAILDELKHMVADPAMKLTFQPKLVDVAKSADMGFTQGTYRMSYTDPVTHKVINDHGNYVTTYRKQADGAWKAVADIVTSEVPPPARAPEPEKKHK